MPFTLNVITWVFIRKTREVREQGESHVIMETKIGVIHFRGGERGHTSRHINNNWKESRESEKLKGSQSPQNFQKAPVLQTT